MKNNPSHQFVKIIFNLLVIFLATSTILLGQVGYHPDSTIVKKGNVYTSNGRVISKDEVDRRLTTFDESAEQYEKSKKRCDRDYYDYGSVNVNVNIPVGRGRTGGY